MSRWTSHCFTQTDLQHDERVVPEEFDVEEGVKSVEGVVSVLIPRLKRIHVHLFQRVSDIVLRVRPTTKSHHNLSGPTNEAYYEMY